MQNDSAKFKKDSITKNNKFFGVLLIVFGLCLSIPFISKAYVFLIENQLKYVRNIEIPKASSVNDCERISDRIKKLESRKCRGNCVMYFYEDYNTCLDNLPGGNPLEPEEQNYDDNQLN